MMSCTKSPMAGSGWALDHCFAPATIDHAAVPRERGDDEAGVHRDELGRRHLRPGVHQDLEPFAEPAGIELFFDSRPRRLPEIQIEDARELRRRGERHHLAALLEAVRLDDLVQQLRRELGDDLCQRRCLENPA